MTQESDQQQPMWSRLLWFGLLWCGGVAAIAIVGYALRSLFFAG
ncbi:DUF2474 domain-containing protein [Hoeflea sp.]